MNESHFTNNNTHQARLEYLDSLRFAAALVVLLSHAKSIMPVNTPNNILIDSLLNPKSAVSFFFVLSGFVLHLAWRSVLPSFHQWVKFIVKRVFRIYPLYYLSLIIAIFLVGANSLKDCPLFVSDETGIGVIKSDHKKITQWIHHILLITPGLEMQFLNPPIWTLAAEMRIALIFPLISWIPRRFNYKLCLAYLVLLFVVTPFVAKKTIPTLSLLPLFFIGAVAAEYRDFFKSLKPRQTFILITAGLSCYSLAFFIRKIGELALVWQLDLAAIGASMVILGLQSSPSLRAILEVRTLVVCGRASYGVYVFHFPILMSLAFAFWKTNIPTYLYLPTSVLIIIPLSLSTYLLIEKPAINIGKKIVSMYK